MSDTCYKKNSDKSYNPNAWVINNDKDIRLEDMRKTFQALGVLQPAKSGKSINLFFDLFDLTFSVTTVRFLQDTLGQAVSL